MPMNVDQGWYDQNQTRRYPFADEASVVSTDGVVTLPDDFLVDLVLSVPLSFDPSTFFVSRVRGYGGGVILTFSSGAEEIATASIPASHQLFDSYAVAPLTSANIIGRVVVGTPTALQSLSVYNAAFDIAATRVAVTCVRPRIAGVDSITVRTADGRSFQLTGQVTFVAGENTSIAVAAPNIAVNVDGGVVYDNRFGCNTDLSGRIPVMSINGVLPDSAGNIDLIGTNCVAVSPGTNGVTISDTCAKPCCGCEELDAITSGEESLKTSLNNVLAYLIGVEAKIAALETNFNRSGIPA
jgi:hypothetical protein